MPAPGALDVLPRLPCVEVPTGPRVDEPSHRCQQLWIAVLERLAVDARGRGGFGVGQATAAQRFAREWFRSPSADRAMVLSLAGIDLDAFKDFGLPRLEAEWARLDARKPLGNPFDRANARRLEAAA